MDKNVDTNKLLDECKELLNDGKDTEQILVFLRERASMKTASIKMVSDLFNISFNEAKRIVHNSNTWADVKERDENFEQVFVDVLNELENE